HTAQRQHRDLKPQTSRDKRCGLATLATDNPPPDQGEASMTRDKLFLLRPDLVDPAYPGRRFYCWHCALMEVIIASFPVIMARIDVERIAWPHPRNEIGALVGEENQFVPLLLLAHDAPSELA